MFRFIVLLALAVCCAAEPTEQEKQQATKDLAEVKASSLKCIAEVESCKGITEYLEQANCLVENYSLLKGDPSVPRPDAPRDPSSEDCKFLVGRFARLLPSAVYAANSFSPDHFSTEVNQYQTNIGCNATGDALPYIWSYHIHVQWEPMGGGRNASDELRNKFVAEFQKDIKPCAPFSFLTDLWNKDNGTITVDNHMFAPICEFPVYPPGGPFFEMERGFHISVTDYHRVLPWVMANRPLNDKVKILIHPNSGCQYNDIYHWSAWASQSVPMFYDILKGCVWVACEDKVMGCIAFNHFRKDSGYGKCYTPPKEMSLDCTMTLEKTSNTSTQTCKAPSTIPQTIV